MALTWERVTFEEMIRHCEGKKRTPPEKHDVERDPDGRVMDFMYLDDGTAVGVSSAEDKCTFAGTEVTPSNWDTVPPKFFIGRPAAKAKKRPR